MAISFHTPTSTSYLHSGIGLPPPPPRVFAGFKHQSPGPFRVVKPNSQFDFRTKVIRSTQSRTRGSKPTQGRIKMMLEMETPMIKRKTPGGGTESVDLWSLLEGERIFIICEDIDEDLSDELQTLLLFFDSQKSDKPFLFIFDCLGGDVHPCLQIYDTLQYLESPIATHCISTAANMAAFLLAAGDKGKRSASPHSMIVLQPLAGTVSGQADDAVNELNELTRVRDYLFNQLSIKTGHPVKKIQKDLERSRTFTAQEALEYGLIDRIIRPPRLNPDPSKIVASELKYY
ncbi:hypothetical protein RHMOL_Rhmol07G0119300 [Rhododendron molle]|uniref:Uncharacterized protein n=1 Tax=Rhododendron molle TaxID=49168 RepID=A0ACC0MZH1_RHOML|nr:hypothetical protein RHMOL_Rhmol07G0119300 [Rhododendron molle]